MASEQYIVGRKKYTRPQAILWADNPGVFIDGFHLPLGQEIGASENLTAGGINRFLILSDHNRSEISFNSERIEKRERTINGRMRSYHIADKLIINVSWNMLPSRGHKYLPKFNANGESLSPRQVNNEGAPIVIDEYTADGGAGGVEILDWYENNKSSFWMYLAYDKYKNFGEDDNSFNNLDRYNQVVEVYFSDFNYTVVKRGKSNHDLWNISATLEEV